MLSYDKYIDFMKKGEFDIGLAPLEDTPFSSRKGIVKYVDYAIVGALGIFSNCMPYNSVIHSGENGFLVDNTPDDWLVTLSFCAENPERVKQMAKTAQDDLLNNYLPDSLIPLLKDEAPEFFSTIRDKSKKVWFLKNPFSHFLYAFRKNWNERIMVSRLIWPLAEKVRNISQQVFKNGVFGAVKYYCKKVIMPNN